MVKKSARRTRRTHVALAALREDKTIGLLPVSKKLC